ncbi:hypothetical protein [Alteraurantiacibacter aquimixticola]|uniref:DUF11 domain-containing protein n=1 Tax=Alteraurantiacibacter aquimixticola TaxID=2489173 RepID=A0A4T3F1P3_9SPHN|nr:hypothetical protein [Alteraurantiacibacter aquimixticola]TIX51125.1 hypothetical protein E5222_01195 [Alteraurantiacibacter aquimixticola]
MKNASHIYLIAASLVGIVATTAVPAHAAGTDAGTLIENTAEATYASGSSNITVTSNTVTIKVDEVLDVTVASNNVSQLAADVAVFSFDVTNTGNGPEAYILEADAALPGTDFEFTVTAIVIDDGDGIYEPGIDTVLPAGSATPALDPDTSVTVFVIGTMPATATDGQSGSIELTANAETGTGAPGTSFTGQGEGGGDAIVGSSSATGNATLSSIASLAVVTLTKSASIADPFGGEEAVPGAAITYSIVADITGSGEISGLNVIDLIPTGTTYSVNSLLLDGTSLTDADDTDGGQANQTDGIHVSLGTVSGGNSHTVTFEVTID